MSETKVQLDEALSAKLEACGHISLPSSGISMGRRWQDAVSLRVAARKLVEPRIGDVIVCQYDGHLIAHRALKRVERHGKWWWITKGDGAWFPDRIPMPDCSVLGRVEKFSDQAGRVTDATSGPSRLYRWLHIAIGRIGVLFRPPIWINHAKSAVWPEK
ncbi:MAG TPA: hypothetical protein PJ991_01510 [Kiritimatiellia bacterium]|nr:hypothetical protein [Kiritimatiellia bacterium]